MKTQQQNNLAARFLLGKLTEAEVVKIEQELFGANDKFENLLIAENDLIDAYVKGILSTEDKRLFENRLLINPGQRQKVEFAKALVKYASRLPVAEDAIYTPAAKSKWLVVFTEFFSDKPVFSYSFAAAAFVIFGIALWLTVNNDATQFFQNSEAASAPTAAETELGKPSIETPFEQQKSEDKASAESEAPKGKSPAASSRLPAGNLNQPAPKNSVEQLKKAAAPVFSTIVLRLGLTRDESVAAKSFGVSAKTDFVNLRLKFEDGDFRSYFAVIETVEGRQVWSGKVFKTTKNKNEKAVTATVPARILKTADYIVSLKGLTENGAYEPVGDYSLTIERR